MSGSNKDFGDLAKGLARNPLGIVALFVVLVYAVTGLVFTFASGFTSSERLLFVVFLVAFPVLIFSTFVWIVVRHHDKLYAPGDYENEDHFVALSKKVDSQVEQEIDKRIADLEDKHEYEICYLRLTSAKFQGRFDVAVNWADQYLENKRDAEILTQKAYCKWELGEQDEALALVCEALKLDGFRKAENRATAFYNRACYRSTLGKDTQLVEQDLRDAIRHNAKYLQMMQEDSDLASFDTAALAKSYE